MSFAAHFVGRIALLALAFVFCFAGMGPEELNSKQLFRNVHVISMTKDEVLENRAVLVEAGRVVRILPNDKAGGIETDQVIDGAGGYLMPGLADMHTHLGLLLPWHGDPAPEGMASDAELYLPFGITTIRNMRGTPGILEMRSSIAAGAVKGPWLFAGGPSLHSELPESFGPKILTADEARKEVMRQMEAGYDFIKVHQNLPQEAFDAVIETAALAEMPVAGHVQTDKPAAQSARLASIEHAEEIARLLKAGQTFDDAPEVLDAIAASGAYVTPTLIVFDTIAKYLTDEDLEALFAKPETAYVSAYWRDVMSKEKNFFRQRYGEGYEAQAEPLRADSERLQTLTRQLHEAGVPLLLGTDAVGLVAPGASVHEELALFVKAGLTPFQALETATVNPARWLGLMGCKSGVVEKGARADLVLLAENPLADIAATRSVKGVMRGGIWFDEAKLNAMLEKRRLSGGPQPIADQ